jgi:epoxide hydrolase-like predicted phosphatase
MSALVSTPVRAVVFDVGGVLEITPTTGWQARWEDRLGLEIGQIDALLHDVYRAGTVGTITLADAEQRIAALLDLDRQEGRELMEDLWTEYLGELDVALYDWCRSCRARYKTGILSNSWVGAREKEHHRYAFADAFDTIVYSHEEGLEKPDPRIYVIVCERLGVLPSEVVFVDDLTANVIAARELGMQALVFTGDTPETIAELERILGSATSR